MWPFKISGKNNAKMHLRTNTLNGKKIGDGFFLNYFILIFIHQTCHIMPYQTKQSMTLYISYFDIIAPW